MSGRLNFKKKQAMIAETNFFFQPRDWFFVRKGPVWVMKIGRMDPAGHTPTQRIRLSRRRKKREKKNRQIHA